MSWIKAIFSFLGELFAFLGDKQLLDAGEAKARDKQNEMDNQARAKAKEIKKAVDNLDANSVVTKLSKYKRK